METLVMPACFRQANHHHLSKIILWNKMGVGTTSLDEERDDGRSP
jgi:hypothetical protein